MTKLRWRRIGTAPLAGYIAECREGELVIAMDHDGWLLMLFPLSSNRTRPIWERAFPTSTAAKRWAQARELTWP